MTINIFENLKDVPSMPRVSREQAESNRAAITEAAARLFRECGISGVSIADLMAAAGLTHGGFYGHFDSKDSLAAEACGLAFDRSVERWRKRVGDGENRVSAKAALIDGYLSAKSRESPGTSCPASSLAGDAAREPQGSVVRYRFASGVEQLVAVLASLEQSGDSETDRQRALGDFATMVGSLTLARATAGNAISDEILAAGRKRLSGGDTAATRRPGATRRSRS